MLDNKHLKLLKEIQGKSHQELLQNKDADGIPYLKHVFTLYQKIFNDLCSNCPSKILGYIQKLKNYNAEKAQKKEIMSKEFRLKEGVILPIAGTSVVYTQHNITGEIAVKLLAENPNRISLFDTVPNDLQKQIKAYVANIIVEAEKVTAKEAADAKAIADAEKAIADAEKARLAAEAKTKADEAARIAKDEPENVEKKK